MTKSTEIEAMEEPSKQPTPKPNPLSFFPKLNLQLPFLPPKPEPQPEPQLQQPKQSQEVQKPNVVRFPKTQAVVVPPLEAEPDPNQSTAKTSNPYILWQIYAFGGILIARWIWARWNERKARGRSPNDDSNEGRLSDDGRSSSDNE